MKPAVFSVSKLLIFLLISVSLLALVVYLRPNNFVEALYSEPQFIPGTKIANLDLSNKTLNEGITILQSYEQKETYLNFPTSSMLIKYQDLGVTFQYNVLYKLTHRCLPLNLYCTEPIDGEVTLEKHLITVNEQKYQSFVNSLNNQVKSFLISPDISFDTLTFKAYDSSATIEIDEELLMSQVTPQQIFTDSPIKINTKVKVGDTHTQSLETSRLIDRAAIVPLTLKYGRQTVHANPETLRSFIEVNTDETYTFAQISQHKIKQYLENIEETYPLNITVEKDAAVLNMAYALLFRVGGEDPQNALILPLKGKPTTDGTHAQKYLELNKEQQRMYAFENGELVKTYIVGTGLLAETPSGEFKILRKEGTAISYVGGWYMPYYMPIGTMGGLYFGFHEIPYRVSAGGQITSRNPNTMGSPATAGCIQLYKSDAKELYEWADVTMPVIIY